MTAPKLSVLIPSYNCARYLPEAIESVLNQDFRDFELLIIDDASKDDSRAVIEKYAAFDSRISFEFNPANLGAVRNWNRCLARAQGDYVKLLCCDDVLITAQSLGKMVALLEANPTAVLAASARLVIDEHSRELEVWTALGEGGLKHGAQAAARCLESNGNLVGEPSAVMFCRANAVRGFNEDYRQLVDLEMWFHLLEQGDIVYTPDPLCAFRKHALQLTAFNSINHIGVDEPGMLLVEYFPKSWLRGHVAREALFIQIYLARKRRRKLGTAKKIEKQLLETLGWGWYSALWLRRKITKPGADLQKWIKKHARGKRSSQVSQPRQEWKSL